MRVLRHNGRAGSHGAYNPKHNDREFDLDKAEEIKKELTANNIYWNCIDGKIIRHYQLDENSTSFTEAGKRFYNVINIKKETSTLFQSKDLTQSKTHFLAIIVNQINVIVNGNFEAKGRCIWQKRRKETAIHKI
ncbi:hypothetical protein SAMN05216390_10673 [Lachnospiraceae bacterium KH1T2]|nr:hypothetical protein SAMN05216390_10673 [Lachnospiraceae bacterium KH1T2]